MAATRDTIEQLFIAAYDDYADAIFRHCVFRLGDREKSKELMQETFMKTWEYLMDGKRVENIRAFLYRVANNLLVDYVRKKQRRPETSLEELQLKGFDAKSDEPSPARIFDQRRIIAMIHRIDMPYRTAVIMRHIDGLPPKQIAAILGVTPNVVSVRINRGLKQLHSLLHPHG